MVNTEDILRKYSAKIESQIGNQSLNQSKDYSQFIADTLKVPSRYERWASILGNLINLKLAEKDRTKFEKYLSDAHVSVTPSQALSLAIFSMLGIFFITLLIGVSFYLITSTIPLLFTFLGLIASLAVFYYVYTMPKRIANQWKLQASSQMVPAILYIVVYMKHTSNFERAIAFAAEHLEGPLALDFKKVFYNVEVGKYPTLKQSLDEYLNSWREYAPEFIESMHLIESSLYEPSESRRVQILEKSLQVILDGVYEKMLKYTREIRSPLTNVYMLGIILPTLALALLPLASALLGDLIKWYHIMILFNILVPFLVFHLTSEALLKRPGGYGESSVLELNPNYSQFKSNKPWIKATIIAIPLIIIGLLPFLFQFQFIESIGLKNDYLLGELGIPFFQEVKLFDFKTSGDSIIGPFGFIASLLGLFIPLGIGLFFYISYRTKTKSLIQDRDKTKELEEEFTNSLFQLGNRLGDNIPAELAFGKVASSTQGQMTQSFFSLVNQNIQNAGMSLESAIFDKKRGAITYYPSQLISTSMHILTESVKKGLQVAARSLMSISEYVKNINKINQRLQDLLAEVISDMKSNMTFLAPLLSGIVVGLGVMIATILNQLSSFKSSLPAEDASGFSLSGFTEIFEISKMMPPYFLQLVIGIYIIEIIFILTKALVTVNSGRDPLKEKYELSSYLKSGLILYTITAGIAIISLSVLASIVLTNV
ncbi:MAG: hypothetical protein AABW80_03920, partial [Nanoarchaeota archaeon]